MCARGGINQGTCVISHTHAICITRAASALHLEVRSNVGEGGGFWRLYALYQTQKHFLHTVLVYIHNLHCRPQRIAFMASAGHDLVGGIDHGPGSNQPVHHLRMAVCRSHDERSPAVLRCEAYPNVWGACDNYRKTMIQDGIRHMWESIDPPDSDER